MQHMPALHVTQGYKPRACVEYGNDGIVSMGQGLNIQRHLVRRLDKWIFCET